MYKLVMNYHNTVQSFEFIVGYFIEKSNAEKYVDILTASELKAYVKVTASDVLIKKMYDRDVSKDILDKFKISKKESNSVYKYMKATMSIDDFNVFRQKLPGKRSVQGWFLNVENSIKKTISKNNLGELKFGVAECIADKLFFAVDRHAKDVVFVIDEVETVDFV